jgi:hypothetical protein
MAEDERERIVKRANDSRRVARAKGVKFGRKPKLTAHQQKEARKRLQAGDSARSIAKFLGVHHTTVLRALTTARAPGSNAFGDIDPKDIATIRGRPGFAPTPDWLLYGTWGGALANLDYNGGWTWGVPPCNKTSVRSPASAGAGTEHRWPGTGFILGVE